MGCVTDDYLNWVIEKLWCKFPRIIHGNGEWIQHLRIKTLQLEFMSLHVTHRISFLFGSSGNHLSWASSDTPPELNLYYIICYLLPSYLLCVQECHGLDTTTFLPSLTQIGPNPRGVLAVHTVLTFMHAWGVWRNLDSLVRQAKV